MYTFLTHINLDQNELRSFAAENLSNAPSSPVSGQLYFDTSTGKLQLWDGSSWLEIPGASQTEFSVTNGEADSLSVGEVVRLNGNVDTTNDRVEVVRALSDQETNVGQPFVIVSGGSSGAEVKIQSRTYLLFDTSSFSAGDQLYLSETNPGQLTNIKPPLPHPVQECGIVTESGTNGIAFICFPRLRRLKEIQKNAEEIYANDNVTINFLSSSSQSFLNFGNQSNTVYTAGFPVQIPQNLGMAGDIEFAMQWVMDGTTSDQVRIDVRLGVSSGDMDDTADTVNDDTIIFLDNGQTTAAWMIQITPQNPPNVTISPGDILNIEIERDTSNTDDDATFTFYMMNFLIRYRD